MDVPYQQFKETLERVFELENRLLNKEWEVLARDSEIAVLRFQIELHNCLQESLAELNDQMLLGV